MSAIESALVVLVSTAETLVGRFRQLHDPSASAGVPAHVTLLHPFKALEEAGEALLERLSDGFAGFAPFEYSLHAIRRFLEVLYLAPNRTSRLGS